jgi:hypothetical protein
MGWLSLLTRAVPKLWRSGLRATSTLWQGGKAATVTVANATAKVASAAARNPKTAVVGGVAAFAGWQKLTNSDESYGTAVGKTLRKGVDGTGDFSHDVVNGFTGKNTVEDVKDTASNVLTDVKDTAAEAKGVLGTLGETLRGISHFLGNLFGGNGTNMFGNFLDNLVHGKVSGLGIGALIAASYLIFGRTGLLGKIGGALMAMMMVGNNAQKQVHTVAQTEENELAREQPTGLRR